MSPHSLLSNRTFTLSDPNHYGYNASVSGGGQAGEFSRSAGFLAYYEVSGTWKCV